MSPDGRAHLDEEQCPYPFCIGDRADERCDECGRPVQRCPVPGCAAPNRISARYCVRCATELPREATDAHGFCTQGGQARDEALPLALDLLVERAIHDHTEDCAAVWQRVAAEGVAVAQPLPIRGGLLVPALNGSPGAPSGPRTGPGAMAATGGITRLDWHDAGSTVAARTLRSRWTVQLHAFPSRASTPIVTGESLISAAQFGDWTVVSLVELEGGSDHVIAALPRRLVPAVPPLLQERPGDWLRVYWLLEGGVAIVQVSLPAVAGGGAVMVEAAGTWPAGEAAGLLMDPRGWLVVVDRRGMLHRLRVDQHLRGMELQGLRAVAGSRDGDGVASAPVALADGRVAFEWRTRDAVFLELVDPASGEAEAVRLGEQAPLEPAVPRRPVVDDRTVYQPSDVDLVHRVLPHPGRPEVTPLRIAEAVPRGPVVTGRFGFVAAGSDGLVALDNLHTGTPRQVRKGVAGAPLAAPVRCGTGLVQLTSQGLSILEGN